MSLFNRGIMIPFNKGDAIQQNIQPLEPSGALRIPLEHAGEKNPELLIDDKILLAAGTVLCRNDDVCPMSGVSGTFGGVVIQNHPLYGDLSYAEILPDGMHRTDSLPPIKDKKPDTETILQRAQDAGIYDELDGTPLYEKLLRWQMPAGDPHLAHATLVADATENDAYGSAGWAVLKEQSADVLDGLHLAAQAVHFTRSHIATMLPRKYRFGLKKTIGRQNLFRVPDEFPVTEYAAEGEEAFRIGVQACLALHNAVRKGEKHLSAVVTIAGDGVPSSRNRRVPFGTSVSEILTVCGADPDAGVILGDAMTGVVTDNRDIPLLPGVTCILALVDHPFIPTGPCTGCGRCAKVCHAGLLPYEIVRRLENMHYERLQHLDARDCDGCGACSAVCPAGREVAVQVLKAGESTGTMLFDWGDDDDEK